MQLFSRLKELNKNLFFDLPPLILYQSLHYKYYNRYPYSNTIKYNDRKYCNVNETLKECFRIADVHDCHLLRLFVMFQ